MTSEDKFKDVAARAGELFDDYMLIARKGNVIMWKASDDTWSTGAAFRYIQHISNQDKFSDIKHYIKEGEEE